MDRNDNEERHYVRPIVYKVISLLKNTDDSAKKITEEFADTVLKFPDDVDRDVDFYSIISNTINEEPCNHHIKMGYGKIDYYVACFSTAPNNEYI